jgi:nucleotide-binding universal stress UspA family protein
MREKYSSSHCVVVGVDGSRSALQAALWAVDEAMDRDVPLRLVSAIDSFESDPGTEGAIRDALAAIESTRKPVKIETEIARDRPVGALVTESRSAAMVCVGSTGLKHAVHGHIGSTASAVVRSAHCAVAVVPISALPSRAGSVLAVMDESPASRTVLELAVREARLRSAQLRVLATRSLEGTGVHAMNEAAAASGRLERQLEPWRRSHPDVDIQPITWHGGVVNYLEHLHTAADSVQLVVAHPRHPGPTDTLLGPSGRAALDAGRCSLLVCERQRWL